METQSQKKKSDGAWFGVAFAVGIISLFILFAGNPAVGILGVIIALVCVGLGYMQRIAASKR